MNNCLNLVDNDVAVDDDVHQYHIQARLGDHSSHKHHALSTVVQSYNLVTMKVM